VTGEGHGVVRGELTVVRPATDDDVGLLVGWHLDPDLARYWDGKMFTPDEMRARLARPRVESFVVEADEEPVGYLQVWWDEPLRGGLDMFLIPSARRRGLGPDAGRAMARHLRHERGWTEVTVDPYAWNEPALRAWRKAGFVDVEERPAHDDYTAPYVLMVWRG
jgi:aminoglycoside 6'-N-acetyltransferase